MEEKTLRLWFDPEGDLLEMEDDLRGGDCLNGDEKFQEGQAAL